MVRSAAEFIIVRNEFYARSYRQIKRVVAVLLLILILLLIYLVYQTKSLKAFPHYFPTTPDGVLIDMPPVNKNHLLLSEQSLADNGAIIGMPPPALTYDQLQPFGENALVLYWAQLAVEFMFDYDYIHYRKVIQDASKYFTPVGHERFIEALINSKNLETVKARSAVVVPKVVGPVKLVRTYLIEGHYAWDLEIPLQLSYESASYPQPLVQKLLATMSIGRVSTLRSPFYGLSIFQLNFQEQASQNVQGAT